jgi:hypothetical protein
MICTAARSSRLLKTVVGPIEETIPLTGRSPGELNIVLGFQQSPEIVEFYRHFRGR